MTENKTTVRETAIALLDDEHGICESGYDCLVILLMDEDENNQDILDAVEATDGRFYISEKHGLPQISPTPGVNMQDPVFIRFCEQHEADPKKLAEALVAIKNSVELYSLTSDPHTGMTREDYEKAMAECEEKLAAAGFKEVDWPGLYPDVKDKDGYDLRLPFDTLV